MTDNIITREEAIDRMKAGLPCETLYPDWKERRPTVWNDFAYNDAQFRIPPEPRREARTYWIHECGEGRRAHKVKMPMCPKCTELVHIREVLPDEVVVRRMTRDEASRRYAQLTGDLDGGIGNSRVNAAIEFASALGLLVEDGK